MYNDSSVIQHKAADELKHYLQSIFKISPKIIKKENLQKNGLYFFLGKGFLADSLNITDTLPKDAFVKAFHNRNIYLGGDDDLDLNSVKYGFFKPVENHNFGTLYAVYDFLENNLGVHWFFPTYLGEFVPDNKEYSFGEEIQVTVPAFTERAFGIEYLSYNKDTAMIWMIRNKTELSNIKLYNHNWRKLVPPSVYFDSLPGLFAEVNEKRRTYNNPNKYAQLCTTNEDLVRLFVDNARQYLKTHPGEKYLSLSPNDNRKFCECENCIKQDTCVNISPAYSRLSNRIFTFYQRVADSIWKDYPDLELGGFAYYQFAAPPCNLKLSDNFHVRLAINNIGFYSKKNLKMDTLTSLIKNWKNKNNNLGFNSWPYSGRWAYPIISTDNYRILITTLYQNNFKQAKFTFLPEWYAQGLDIWLITKMLWKPDVDIDSLKEIYYQAVYPKSNEIIRNFHTVLQNRVDTLDIFQWKYTSTIERLRDIYMKLYDESFLRETKFKIENALKDKKVTGKERENLLNMKNLFDFLILEYDAYSTYRQMKLLPGKQARNDFEKSISLLRKSPGLAYHSAYFDPSKSPSLFISNRGILKILKHVW